LLTTLLYYTIVLKRDYFLSIKVLKMEQREIKINGIKVLVNVPDSLLEEEQ